MKVVHVHRLRGIGGSERHLLTLLPALRALGVDARFAGLDDGDPDPFYEQLAAARVPFRRIRSPRDLDPGLAGRLARIVHAERPDVVHTHLVHGDLYGTLAAVPSRVPVVSTKHNDDPFRAGPFRFLERALTLRAARVICITSALRDFNVQQVGLPERKLEVIRYGLDELPAAWGPPGGPELPARARVLLAIARLEPQKGLDVAIVALARVRRQHPDAVLVVLGSGPLEAELEELAREHGVEHAVHLPGRSGDVAHWLERSELLVHPARWEGFGLVLLEAMLASRPVVATRVSAIPEVVEDGATGLLVAPDDSVALATAIETLLSDRARGVAYGQAGLERARQHFSVASMARRTVDVYERVAGS